MTWYADEILAPGSPAILRALRDDSRLWPFTHHLRPPLAFDWHHPSVVHGLPDEGLVVVRPVCEPSGHRAEWYGTPVLDWGGFSGSSESRPAVPRALVAEKSGIPEDELPPVELLSYLKHLAQRTGSSVVFYACQTWGGDIDREYAFLFGETESALVFLRGDGNGDEIAAIDARGEERVFTGDLLTTALATIPLHLPTSYFAPHTRRFPWDRY